MTTFICPLEFPLFKSYFRIIHSTKSVLNKIQKCKQAIMRRVSCHRTTTLRISFHCKQTLDNNKELKITQENSFYLFAFCAQHNTISLEVSGVHLLKMSFFSLVMHMYANCKDKTFIWINLVSQRILASG